MTGWIGVLKCLRCGSKGVLGAVAAAVHDALRQARDDVASGESRGQFGSGNCESNDASECKHVQDNERVRWMKRLEKAVEALRCKEPGLPAFILHTGITDVVSSCRCTVYVTESSMAVTSSSSGVMGTGLSTLAGGGPEHRAANVSQVRAHKVP